MPVTNDAVMEFLLSRRSRPAKTLRAPGPSRADLAPILAAALRSPDHKKLEPWRLVVLEAGALGRLADLVEPRGAALGRDPKDIQKERSAYANSPLAVAVIGQPRVNDKVPAVEQVLSAGAVCVALLNAALASGWGANWLSGWPIHDAGFAAEGFGCEGEEWVAGVIHMGTETSAPPERPRPDPKTKITWMDA